MFSLYEQPLYLVFKIQLILLLSIVQDIVRHQRSTESMDALQGATPSVTGSVEDLEDPSQVSLRSW